MIKIKYNRCEYDNCVYFKQNDDLTYLVLYVDNMLIAVRNKVHIQKLKAQLKKEFNMKDLGEVKKILGMKITWDTGMKITWAISRELHYESVGKFNMTKARLSPLFWHVTSNYRPSSVHNHWKRTRRCLEYHMLVRWDHLWFALDLTYPMQLVQ